MIAPVNNTVYTLIRYLVCHISTTVTQYAPCHVQLYVRANIFFHKSSAGKFITGSFFAMVVTKIL